MLIHLNNKREAKGAVFTASGDRLFDGQHQGGLRPVACSMRLTWSIGRSG